MQTRAENFYIINKETEPSGRRILKVGILNFLNDKNKFLIILI